jgi:signal transduction histidine kinase
MSDTGRTGENDSADELLPTVARDLAAGRDLSRMLRRIAGLALRAADAAAVCLERVHPDLGEVEIIATAGDAETAAGRRMPYPGSLAEEVLSRKEPEVVSPAELAKRPIAELLPGSCRGCPALVVPLVAEEEVIGAMTILRRSDGRAFTPEDSGRMRVLGDLAAVALQRALLQERLEGSVAALRTANRAKADFLATMSHELRTPINAIIGYSDLLDAGVAGSLNDGQKSYLDRVRSSSRNLLTLIADVLDMAKMEAGRLRIRKRTTPLAEAVSVAVEMLRPQATARGLALTEACDDAPFVRADPDRLRQVLVNLIGNAVKFTEPGGRVLITCDSAPAPPTGADVEGNGPWTLVRVQDTGIGIESDRLAGIWQPFEQIDSGRTRSREGSGLGLAISRSLARMMGGDILVHSEPGSGSTFLLVLPQSSEKTRPATSDRRSAARKANGIAAVGGAAIACIDPILRAYVERLRTDAGVPVAWSMPPTELERHTATLVVDIAESLAAIEEAAGSASPALRDAQEIQSTIAAKHGLSRARFGWSPDELRRDYAILREELSRAVRAALEESEPAESVAAGIGHGLELFDRFLERAERVSLAQLED